MHAEQMTMTKSTVELISCGICKETLDKMSAFLLAPCKHGLCSKCMVGNLMAKARFNKFRCPACHLVVESHLHRNEETFHNNPPPRVEKDPFRCFQALPDEERRGKMLVAVAVGEGDSKGSGFVRHTVMVDVEREAESDESKARLVALLLLLRLPVFAGCRKAEDMKPVPLMSPFQWVQWALHHDDRAITRHLLAFLLGIPDLQEARKIAAKDSETKSKLLANALMVDVSLRQVSLHHPQRMQKVIGNVVSQLPQSSSFHQFLSRLRLSTHKTTVRNAISSTAVKRTVEGMQADPEGFLHWIVDNCDCKGGNGSAESCAHMLACNYQKEDVDNARSMDLEVDWSMENGVEWEELLEKGTGAEGGEEFQESNGNDNQLHPIVDQVFGTKDSDWKTHSSRQLSHFAAAASAVLPSAEESIAIENDGRHGDAGKVPMHLGTPLATPRQPSRASPSLLEAAEKAADNAVLRPQGRIWTTTCDRNKIKIQVPFHASLAASKTVQEITDSCIRSMERAMQGRQDKDGNGIQGAIVAVCGDGSPVDLFLRMKADKEANGDHSYEGVKWFSSAFHFFINSLRILNGKHSHETHAHFCSLWRQTSRRLDFALSCPNPRDIFWESQQHHVGMIRSVVDSLQTENHRVADNPAMANDLLLSRSVHYPICFAVLIHLKFTAIVIMLRDSWRSGDHGDVGQCLTAMRCLLRLEAIANACKCLRINTDFLRWHKCASNCQKKMFEHFLFTKKTPNGELMPSDLCMELHINHARGMFGKKVFSNMEARIQAEVPNLDKNATLFRNHCEVSGKQFAPHNDRFLDLGEPFIKTCNEAIRLNLWGVGPPNIDDVENLMGLRSKKTMNSAFLNSWTIGEARVASYCQEYEINNPLENNRMAVSLSRLKSAGGQSLGDLKKDLTKLTSRNVEDLMKLGTCLTKDEILEELDVIRNWLDEEEVDALELSCTRSTKKDLLVETLVEARELWFDRNPEALEDRMEEHEMGELADMFTTVETRRREMQAAEVLCKIHPDAEVPTEV